MTHPGPPDIPIRLTTTCPRCNSIQIVTFGIDAERAFVWCACEACTHTWALPHGFSIEAADPGAAGPPKRPGVYDALGRQVRRREA